MTIRAFFQSRSWQLFLLAIVSVVVWQGLAAYLSGEEWHRRSFFAEQLYLPLMILSFIACVAAPFLSSETLPQRFGLAVLAAVAFVVVFLASWFMSVRVFI
jgi:multidrug transporter EmrE-like cation transporter